MADLLRKRADEVQGLGEISGFAYVLMPTNTPEPAPIWTVVQGKLLSPPAFMQFLTENMTASMNPYGGVEASDRAPAFGRRL